MKKVIQTVFAILLAAVVVSAGVWYAWKKSCESFLQNTVVSGQYEIEMGQSFSSVYRQLLKGLTPPLGFFDYLVRIKGIEKNIHFGYYEANAIPLAELIADVVSGRQTLEKVTIPEGYNMYDIATTLENAGIIDTKTMLSVFTDKELINTLTDNNYESLEGFLAPGTYFFAKRYPPEKIATKMVEEFNRTLPFDFREKVEALGLSFYDAIILASIVQKETYDKDEAPIVAAVFLNRIKARMLIQADPTIIYGKYSVYDGTISKADLQDRANRYNTYKHKGLPPTPISNPSVIALTAVANPEKNDYYYFVAKKDGKHVFSKSYNEHRRNVRIHQLGMKR
ncbi:MAG: endolytic transglycosylase MltG [Deferribacteraceae bacterium]|jgi:UPF0755 protein|nr:endolytic transglycosylase MltG [Deferribacteraceae bacterium]